VIAISDGYHGCHGVIALLTRLYGLRVVPLEDVAAWDAAGLGKGDVVHVETPLNPTGEAVHLARYRALASERGAVLSVDATFAPPPLADPFALGVDVVMHSGTKYFGGHSDLLCGVLATRDRELYAGLFEDRIYLGGVMGGLEGWLGVRSLRTLEVRVRTQSEGATKLVAWIDAATNGTAVQGHVTPTEDEVQVLTRGIARIQHASLQKEEWVLEQMPGGFGPVFALTMKSKELARRLPSKLHLFHHATSLGGVESLIEWRRMSDPGVDDRLLRVSVGLEGWVDLRRDLVQAIRAVAADLQVSASQ
jgi:cystathionine gamma-synthase